MKNNNFASKKLRILIAALTLTAMLTTLTGCFGVPSINNKPDPDVTDSGHGDDNSEPDFYESSSDSDTPSSHNDSESSDSESSQPATSSKAYKLNETATIGALDITAKSVDESEGDDYTVPANGNVLLGIELLFENNSKNDVEISMHSNFVAYVDDMSTPYSFEAGSFFNDYSNDGKIAAGKKLSFYYPLEVPEDWEKVELYYYEDSYYTEEKESAIFLLTNS